MICAIHQPNFFPWLGYFDKIKSSDIFVILDDVQIIKTGSSNTNRISLNINGKSNDFTAPIKRVSGVQNINEVEFTKTNWKIKLKKTIQANYAKSKNFEKYRDKIFELINFESDNLCEYNINTIKGLCAILNIEYKSKFILSSSLDVVTQSEQRIIDICKKVKCDTYISGNGARAYQNEINFKRQGIQLIYQEFEHPIYTQNKGNGFIKGLSSLDYIFEALDV